MAMPHQAPGSLATALAGLKVSFDPQHFRWRGVEAQAYKFALGDQRGMGWRDVSRFTIACPPVVPSRFELRYFELAAGGYLEVFLTRAAGGGAGRPSKRYRASGPAAGLEVPLRSDDLMITLLGRALALVPPDQAEAMAEQVGEDYGRELAGPVGGRVGHVA